MSDEAPPAPDDSALWAELYGPRHDGTDLIYSARSDDGEPTAYWTVQLRHGENGRWLFRVRTYRDLWECCPCYGTEQEARVAAYKWLTDYCARGAAAD